MRGIAMSWWGWIVGGAILLGAELAFVDAQFYLVFVGGAAILVGLAAGLVDVAPWAQWAAFAALAVVLMVTFRSRVYQHLRGLRAAPAVQSGPVGSVMTLPVLLGPGETCRAEHGGTFWTVCNDSDMPIPSGARARIARVEGLTLLVRPNT
jgi:membrane protein implicated in regulation of membrane protease activity